MNIFDISTPKGCSIKGTRCTPVAAESTGSNIHVLRAIINHNIIHKELKGVVLKRKCINVGQDCSRLAMKKHGEFIVLLSRT